MGGIPRTDGDTYPHDLEDVVIHHQVYAQAAPGAGQAVQGEVLRPHAGMEEFRLVAGHDDGEIFAGGQGFAGAGQVLPGQRQGCSSGLETYLSPGTSEQIGTVHGQGVPVSFEQPAGFGQRRFRNDGTVFARGTQGAEGHQRQFSQGRVELTGPNPGPARKNGSNCSSKNPGSILWWQIGEAHIKGNPADRSVVLFNDLSPCSCYQGHLDGQGTHEGLKGPLTVEPTCLDANRAGDYHPFPIIGR